MMNRLVHGTSSTKHDAQSSAGINQSVIAHSGEGGRLGARTVARHDRDDARRRHILEERLRESTAGHRGGRWPLEQRRTCRGDVLLHCGRLEHAGPQAKAGRGFGRPVSALDRTRASEQEGALKRRGGSAGSLAIDWRGHGESAPPADAPSVHRLVRHVHAPRGRRYANGTGRHADQPSPAVCSAARAALMGRTFAGVLAVERIARVFITLIIVLLVAAYLTVRVVERRGSGDAIVAGFEWLPVPILGAVVFLIAASQVHVVVNSLPVLGRVTAVFGVSLVAAAALGVAIARAVHLESGPARTLVFSLGTRNSFVVLRSPSRCLDPGTSPSSSSCCSCWSSCGEWWRISVGYPACCCGPTVEHDSAKQEAACSTLTRCDAPTRQYRATSRIAFRTSADPGRIVSSRAGA